MKSKLDKRRSYGEIIGQSKARFEQDGKQFDHAGNEIVDSFVCDCGKDFTTQKGLTMHQGRYKCLPK